MPPTTELTIYKLKDEMLNRLRSAINSYDSQSRVTETTSTFTATAGQTNFLLSTTTLSYVKSVTVNSTSLKYITDYDINWRGTNAGYVTLVNGATVGQTVIIVWGSRTTGRTNFVYPDWPQASLGITEYPRVGFEMTVSSSPGGGGGNLKYVVKNSVLIQIKVVDVDTYNIDLTITAIRDFILQNLKNFYYMNYIEPQSIQNYDTYRDNINETNYKIIEFIAPSKFEIVTLNQNGA